MYALLPRDTLSMNDDRVASAVHGMDTADSAVDTPAQCASATYTLSDSTVTDATPLATPLTIEAIAVSQSLDVSY